jgi:hypothetical protein
MPDVRPPNCVARTAPPLGLGHGAPRPSRVIPAPLTHQKYMQCVGRRAPRRCDSDGSRACRTRIAPGFLFVPGVRIASPAKVQRRGVDSHLVKPGPRGPHDPAGQGGTDAGLSLETALPGFVLLSRISMVFSARCAHCGRIVFADASQIGASQVRELQHHLLRGCRSDEVVQDDFGKLVQHFRITMGESTRR